MKTVLLIDANNIGFASMNGNAKLVSGDTETTAIYGFVRTMRVVMSGYKDAHPIVLWDGRSWRKDIFKGYKVNRDTDSKMAEIKARYVKQRPMISRAARLLGMKQIMANNLEADDLAGLIVAKKQDDQKIVMISGDKDWLQLVRENVVWADPIRERRCTHASFEDFTGYTDPAGFLQGKALQGDTSDNVPGVGGIGEKGAQDMIRIYGSVANFLEQAKDLTIKMPKKFADFYEDIDRRAIFDRNMRLMNLMDAQVKPEGLKIVESALNTEAFKGFCEEHAFLSILKQYDHWVQPFIREQTPTP